jgi:hypothetical protein
MEARIREQVGREMREKMEAEAAAKAATEAKAASDAAAAKAASDAANAKAAAEAAAAKAASDAAAKAAADAAVAAAAAAVPAGPSEEERRIMEETRRQLMDSMAAPAAPEEPVLEAAPVPEPVASAMPAREPFASSSKPSSQEDEPLTETMADLYMSQGHEDEALRILTEILRKDPSRADLRLKISEIQTKRAFPQAPKSAAAPVVPPSAVAAAPVRAKPRVSYV